MTRDVDSIAEGIRQGLLAMAPRIPSPEHRSALEAEVVKAHGMRIVRRGLDIEGRPFLQVEPRPDSGA